MVTVNIAWDLELCKFMLVAPVTPEGESLMKIFYTVVFETDLEWFILGTYSERLKLKVDIIS